MAELPNHDATIRTPLYPNEPDFPYEVFVTGVQVGNVVIASISNMLVAFPADAPADTVNFGAYMDGMLPHEATLVFFNPGTRMFEEAS